MTARPTLPAPTSRLLLNMLLLHCRCRHRYPVVIRYITISVVRYSRSFRCPLLSQSPSSVILTFPLFVIPRFSVVRCSPRFPLSVIPTISIVRFPHNFRSSPFRFYIPYIPHSVLPIPFIQFPSHFSCWPPTRSATRHPSHARLSVAPSMPFSAPPAHSAVQIIRETEK